MTLSGVPRPIAAAEGTPDTHHLPALPKPVQSPHSPLFLASNSNDTFAYAARMGLGIIGTILSQPMPRLVQRLAEFEAAKPKTSPPARPYSQRGYPNLNAAICRESDAEAEPPPGHVITAPTGRAKVKI